MTNLERLLDLPLREIISEIKRNTVIDEKKAVARLVSCLITCSPDVPQCRFCYKDITKACISSCEYWLDIEPAPDANYNDDVWRDASVELPICGDTTERYLAVIYGASLPTLLTYDGDNFIDPDMDDYITYKVRYWRPLPELPQNKPTE